MVLVATPTVDGDDSAGLKSGGDSDGMVRKHPSHLKQPPKSDDRIGRQKDGATTVTESCRSLWVCRIDLDRSLVSKIVMLK